MLLTGHKGELRVGYSVAARISDWSITCDSTLGKQHQCLTAKVVGADGFWSLQPIDSVWLHMGGGSWWVWGSARKSVDLVLGTTVDIELRGGPEVRVNHLEAQRHGKN